MNLQNLQFPTLTADSKSIPWWVILIEGIAAGIIGVLLLISPGVTTLILVQVLGWYWLITGLLSFVSLFVDRSQWGWKVVAGVLGVIAGFLVIRHPLWSSFMVLTMLVIILAVQAIIVGATQLIQAFNGGGVGIAILGILNLIIGLLLVFYPVRSPLALPIVVGIVSLIIGIITVIGSFLQRSRTAVASP